MIKLLISELCEPRDAIGQWSDWPSQNTAGFSEDVSANEPNFKRVTSMRSINVPHLLHLGLRIARPRWPGLFPLLLPPLTALEQPAHARRDPRVPLGLLELLHLLCCCCLWPLHGKVKPVHGLAKSLERLKIHVAHVHMYRLQVAQASEVQLSSCVTLGNKFLTCPVFRKNKDWDLHRKRQVQWR